MKGLLNEKTNSTITMKESKISLGAGIGLLAGIIIGSATDNVGLWIALGLVLSFNTRCLSLRLLIFVNYFKFYI